LFLLLAFAAALSGASAWFDRHPTIVLRPVVTHRILDLLAGSDTR
jgi:hypothetical protein